MYYNDNQSFPKQGATTGTGCSFYGIAVSDRTTAGDCTNWQDFASFLVPNYIKKIPQDPKLGGTCCSDQWFVYVFQSDNSGQWYRLCTNLENNSDSQRNDASQCSWGSTVFDYLVQNP